MRSIIFLSLFLPLPLALTAQFAPAAGQPGSTAIEAESISFAGWASGVVVSRGLQDVAQPDLGLTSAGLTENALGFPDNNTVSLGDGGSAVLTFDFPLEDHPGYDFAVFENSFNDHFLELAFVEVSSNGTDFVRFPATSLTQTETPVGGFGSVDPTQIDNFAGKYRAGYGVPFDLAQLQDSTQLDLQSITHIRIVDAVGTLDPEFATYDHLGNLVNEIYPTPFETGGFDLDAVGIIEQLSTSRSAQAETFRVFPNPVASGQSIRLPGYEGQTLRLIGTTGLRYELPIHGTSVPITLPAGVYTGQVGEAIFRLLVL